MKNPRKRLPKMKRPQRDDDSSAGGILDYDPTIL